MNTFLPGNNGYFNMNTSGKYTVVLTNLFLLKDLEKLTNLFLFDVHLEVRISCSEKSNLITKSFEPNSKWISSSLKIPNESISMEFFLFLERHQGIKISISILWETGQLPPRPVKHVLNRRKKENHINICIEKRGLFLVLLLIT